MSRQKQLPSNPPKKQPHRRSLDFSNSYIDSVYKIVCEFSELSFTAQYPQGHPFFDYKNGAFGYNPWVCFRRIRGRYRNDITHTTVYNTEDDESLMDWYSKEKQFWTPNQKQLILDELSKIKNK